MYQDKVYEQALKDSKEVSVNELKGEVKSMEKLIERLLTQLLECSAIEAERDYHVCGV